jgi:hypothetical protein
MEANRLRVKTGIMKNLQLPVEAYSLEQAFSDLMSYQMAASLEGAIQSVAAEASSDAASAQRDYEKVTIAFASCDADETTGNLWGRINAGIRSLNKDANPEQLKTVGDLLGLTPQELGDAGAVAKRLNQQFCSPTTAGALIDSINQATSRSF